MEKCGDTGDTHEKKVGTQNGRPMIKHFFHGKLWKTMETHRTHEKNIGRPWKTMENHRQTWETHEHIGKTMEKL